VPVYQSVSVFRSRVSCQCTCLSVCLSVACLPICLTVCLFFYRSQTLCALCYMLLCCCSQPLIPCPPCLPSVRLDLSQMNKDYDKTEDDLKAIQNVGQIIGEVLKRLDDERCKHPHTHHHHYSSTRNCNHHHLYPC
jgi:hypothetical protein